MGNLISGSLEKIYTPHKITDYIITNFIDEYDFNEILEPCAGSGYMLDRIKERIPGKLMRAYDIYNEEEREDIIEIDFLKGKLDLEYNEKRICIMNPPFSKGIKFIYKTLEYCKICYVICSMNTFMNIDYENYDVEKIHLIKKTKFIGDDKIYNTSIMKIRKKL